MDGLTIEEMAEVRTSLLRINLELVALREHIQRLSKSDKVLLHGKTTLEDFVGDRNTYDTIEDIRRQIDRFEQGVVSELLKYCTVNIPEENRDFITRILMAGTE